MLTRMIETASTSTLCHIVIFNMKDSAAKYQPKKWHGQQHWNSQAASWIFKMFKNSKPQPWHVELPKQQCMVICFVTLSFAVWRTLHQSIGLHIVMGLWGQKDRGLHNQNCNWANGDSAPLLHRAAELHTLTPHNKFTPSPVQYFVPSLWPQPSGRNPPPTLVVGKVYVKQIQYSISL